MEEAYENDFFKTKNRHILKEENVRRENFFSLEFFRIFGENFKSLAQKMAELLD